MDYHREQYRKPEQVEFNPVGDFREDDLFDESGSRRKEARPISGKSFIVRNCNSEFVWKPTGLRNDSKDI